MICKREGIVNGGWFDDIKYYYTSLITYRPKNFLLRNLFKSIGIINELIYIFFIRIKHKKIIIFNNSTKLISLKYYYFISRILNIKIVYDYVEFVSSISNRDVPVDIDNLKIFDNVFHKYIDKCIVISGFLLEHVSKNLRNNHLIQIPPTMDYESLNQIKLQSIKEKFFLFCGGAAYDDIIHFIILCFKKSKSIENGYQLKLILSGNENQIGIIKRMIKRLDLEKKISIDTEIEYSQLFSLYKSSFALLIPFSNNLQDKARFPFKISEYCASASTIITSDSNQIVRYFTHRKSALIAEIESADDYIKQINYLIDNPKKSAEIGISGYEVGLNYFNYKNYIKEMKTFLDL